MKIYLNVWLTGLIGKKRSVEDFGENDGALRHSS